MALSLRRAARAIGAVIERFGRGIRSRYDAAEYTEENSAHWAKVDSRNANAVNTPGMRHTLRDRARYEADNNSYLSGLIEKLANDLVGTGPRLQITLPDGSPDGAAARIETSFSAWGLATNFSGNLHIAHMTKVRDGETLALSITNPVIEHDVKLDYRWYEADQITTPFLYPFDPLVSDGIRIDELGNPTEYHFLKIHPGSAVLPWLALQGEYFPRKRVLHWYTPKRPGQLRGIPDVTPALPLFAQLRRYTLATLSAAEMAAMISGIIETNLPAEDGGDVEVKTMEAIHLVRNALLSLPDQWKMNQLQAQQPTTGFKEFVRQILNEIGCALVTPLNLISGNSSDYNYSSGRLDFVPYHRHVRIARNQLRIRVLDRVFREWLTEAMLAIPELFAGLPPVSQWQWTWYFDGFESIDPVKDNTADGLALANGSTTLQRICAENGDDYEAVLNQQAREKARRKQLGLSDPPPVVTQKDAVKEEEAQHGQAQPQAA